MLVIKCSIVGRVHEFCNKVSLFFRIRANKYVIVVFCNVVELLRELFVGEEFFHRRIN